MKYLLIIFLFAQSIMAAVDSVKTVSNDPIGAQADENWLTTMPRDYEVVTSYGWYVQLTKGDRVRLSADSGQTWIDSVDFPETWALNTHSHVTIVNDFVYIVPLSGDGTGWDDSCYVWIIDATDSALTQIAGRIIELTTDTYIYSGEVRGIPGTDSLLWAGRCIGSSNQGDIYATFSTDTFATNGVTYQLRDDATADARVGMFTFDNTVGIFDFVRDDSVLAYIWNRGNNDFDTVTLLTGGFNDYYRNFSGASLGDSILYLITQDYDPFNYMMYSWYHKDSTAAVKDTLSTINSNFFGKSSVTYVEAADAIFFFYSLDPDSATYFDVYCRWINASNPDSLSDEIKVISSDTLNAYRFDTPDIIPAAMGNYIPIYVNETPGDWGAIPAVQEIVGLRVYTASPSIPDTVYISSLPFTIDSSGTLGDTVYYAFDTTCLEATGDGISYADGTQYTKLCLGEDTLKFDVAGSGGRNGISIRRDNLAYNVIDSGHIMEWIPDTTYNISYSNNCVLISGIPGTNPTLNNVHDFTFQYVHFAIAGTDGQIIDDNMISSQDVYNIRTIECKYESHMKAFQDRQDFYLHALVNISHQDSGSAVNQPDFEYFYQSINDSTINSHWVVFHLEGNYHRSTIYDGYHMVDARNEYNSVQGLDLSYADQCYAIVIRGDGRQEPESQNSICRIENVVIRSGDNYGGGRGIFVGDFNGYNLHDDSCLIITGCDIKVHQGPYTMQYRTCNGILVREGWRNVKIYNNKINVYSTMAGGDSTNAYEGYPNCCIRMTALADASGIPPYQGYLAQDNLIIANNVCSSFFNIEGSTFQYGAAGRSTQNLWFDTWNNLMYLQNVQVYGNEFYSNCYNFHWGGNNGQGGSIILGPDNIVGGINGANEQTFLFDYGAGETRDGYHNFFFDNVYIPPAYDTSIYIERVEADSMAIAHAVTHAVVVYDSTGSLLEGANVTMKNNYGYTILSGLTDQFGRIEDTTKYWHEFNPTFSNPDSINYSPVEIVISYGGLADTIVKNIFYADTLTVDTMGTALPSEPTDTVPQNLKGIKR